MTVDRSRLADLAQEATDVWWYKADSCDYGLENIDPEKARFIAAADPETVLAVLADLDTAERVRASLRALVETVEEDRSKPYWSTNVRVVAMKAREVLAEHGDVS